MSHLSKIFEEAPVKVQNRNGFDLSHLHSGTSKCGQLVPVLTKLLVPNSTISLGVQAEVNLPPIVAPFYGKVDFAIEGFVVPCSILYGGWKQFISNQEATQFPANQLTAGVANTDGILTTSSGIGTSGTSGVYPATMRVGYELPKFDLFRCDANDIADFHTLYGKNENIYEYMGLNVDASTTTASAGDFYINLLPAIAYHKIVDTFYRNTKLTKTWFAVNPNIGISDYAAATPYYGVSGMHDKNVSLIWHSFYTNSDLVDGGTNVLHSTGCNFTTTAQLTFPDNVSVFSTRQRTYMRDYFTSGVASPQQGGASTLQFNVDSVDYVGTFTISALRNANALQKFLETNQLSGDYADMVRNRWGVRPIDADFEEPHYLGRVVIPVYQKSVAKSDTYVGSSTGNPFVSAGSLGAKAGTAGTNGEGSICDNFNVSCWSYLMVLASIYPHANYNQGINKELTMLKLGDFPAPELQSVGMEEVKNYEIAATVTDASSAQFKSTFSYLPRFSRVKYMDDHCSGELRPGESLQHFQLQRVFTGTPTLGTDFVTIPSDALDPVLSVSTSTMNLTCWWEIFFNLKVVMPLADFCIPTLGELGDTHTIKSTVGGSRL